MKQTFAAFFSEIQRATVQARERTGIQGLGTCIRQGRYQIVIVTFPKGSRSKVEPVGPWRPMAETVMALDAMVAP
jgi:hypothetical protein